MSFIQVTSTENTVLLDLNLYESALTTNYYLIDKRDVMRIVERTDYVEVWITQAREPYVFAHSVNSQNAMIIESVDGNEVSSNHDLFVKLLHLKDPLIVAP